MNFHTKLILPSKTSALGKLNRFLKRKEFDGARFFILLDENTYSHCLATLVQNVSALEESEFLEVPIGEEAKSLEIAAQLWQTLMESGADRNSVLVNLGGGSICDLGGFVAAAYKRGIRYVNVPTTLLAMVDASVGGKTAVDFASVKNQIGFFHHPVATCIEPLFLQTTSDRDILCGMAEMIKGQMLRGEWTRQSTPLTIEAIVDEVNFKMQVVQSDVKDHGIRKILNFGHTFGHAIESFSSHRESVMSHGESVALGLWCELYLSVRKLNLEKSILDDYQAVMQTMVSVPEYTLQDAVAMLDTMRNDKKNAEGLILCVLLQDLGVPVIDVPIAKEEVIDAFMALQKLHDAK